MDQVDESKFNSAKDLPAIKNTSSGLEIAELSEQDFSSMLISMQNPVDAQKHLAVQIKHYLDNKIDHEMRSKGFLSDHTRRWVDTFNSLLEKIQKALYGDKSVNLHVHKISHSDIATKVREAKQVGPD